MERPRLPRRAGIDVLSREEVMALVRAAETEEDGVLYLTAAFTGLRLGELLALRWEDVDFEADAIRVRRNFTSGTEGTPKSGRGRAVPMMDEVAQALARHGQRQRFMGDQDLVFCDPLGRHLGYKSLSRRYKEALERAELRELRFHDLRHTFGTHAIRHADPARGHGVDGPRRPGDDAEVSRVQAAGGRGATAVSGVPGRRLLCSRQSPLTRSAASCARPWLWRRQANYSPPAAVAEMGSENTIYHLAAWALAQCDRFREAERALDACIEMARDEGSVVGFARALNFRANLSYRRGLLREAEADATRALDHLTPIAAPLAVAFLIDVLIERDRLSEADELLKRFDLASQVPRSILGTIVLERRGRLRLAQGRPREAADDLLACRERSIAWGAESPAFLPSRSSLALALHHVARKPEADELVAEEVEVARRFGAPRAIGVALRAQGLLAGGEEGLALLRNSTEALHGSGAALEHAGSLVDLGAALRRLGKRRESRRELRAGVRLAQQCAATALAQRGRAELRSAGGRPVDPYETGVDALSPTEFRVAKMAASGLTNREIAQTLFVTPKTVEWHLGQAYRKLGIHSRTELPRMLHRDRGNGKIGAAPPSKTAA